MPPCPTCHRTVPVLPCPFCAHGAPVKAAPIVPPKPLPPTPVNALPQGAVLGLQCKTGAATQFVDVDVSHKLYILKGSSVTFKLAAKNTAQAVTFTSATWSGVAIGNGAQSTVTFNSNSPTNNDAGARTVTATFNGNPISVGCIVYELTAAVLFEDDVANTHSQNDCGVDERMNLGFTVLPAGVTAAEVGGLRWSIHEPLIKGRDSSGLIYKSKAALTPVETDGKAYYIAPRLTDDVHKPPTAATRQVRLRLSVERGGCAGAFVEKALTVHMPIAHMTAQAGSDKHQQGMASAGFLGLIHLFPRNVSFKSLLWREGGGRSVANGVMAHWNNLPHQTTNMDPGTGRKLTEMPVAKGAPATGCKVEQIDDVFSGSINYAIPGGANPATEVGRFTWPIYWQYVPADAKLLGWVTFQVAQHVAVCFQDGRMEMRKGHTGCAECTAVASKMVTDANERYP